MPRWILWLGAALLAATPAHSNEVSSLPVRILPERPVPGSTVQVLTENEVNVRLGEDTYQSFQAPTGQWRTLVPISALRPPGRYPLVLQTSDGEQSLELPLSPRTFRLQRLRLPRNRADLKATPIEESQIGEALRTVSAEQLWALPFRRPVGGRISGAFGLRRTYNGVFAPNYYHRGYDFAAPQGAGVIAPAAGRVVLVGTTQRGYRLHGNTLVLDHGQGVTSIYIHLSRILVRQGETVKAGQRIARVGSTGRASGPHLHWGFT